MILEIKLLELEILPQGDECQQKFATFYRFAAPRKSLLSQFDKGVEAHPARLAADCPLAAISIKPQNRQIGYEPGTSSDCRRRGK